MRTFDDQEWSEDRAQTAFRKLAEAVRVFREEGGSGKPMGSLTAWSLVLHEHDFAEDSSFISEWHEQGQAPALTMAILDAAYTRYRNTMSMMGIANRIIMELKQDRDS